MTEPYKMDPNRALHVAVRQAQVADDIERVLAMGDEEVERELAQVMAARQAGRAAAPAVAQATSPDPVPRNPLRVRAAWVAAASAAGLVTAGLTVGRPVLTALVGGDTSRPHETPHDTQPRDTTEPKPADRFEELVQEAQRACGAGEGHLKECLAALDQADPTGRSTDPRVVAMREHAASEELRLENKKQK